MSTNELFVVSIYILREITSIIISGVKSWVLSHGHTGLLYPYRSRPWNVRASVWRYKLTCNPGYSLLSAECLLRRLSNSNRKSMNKSKSKSKKERDEKGISFKRESSRTCLDAAWWLEIRARRCYFFRESASTTTMSNTRCIGESR